MLTASDNPFAEPRSFVWWDASRWLEYAALAMFLLMLAKAYGRTVISLPNLAWGTRKSAQPGAAA